MDVLVESESILFSSIYIDNLANKFGVSCACYLHQTNGDICSLLNMYAFQQTA